MLESSQHLTMSFIICLLFTLLFWRHQTLPQLQLAPLWKPHLKSAFQNQPLSQMANPQFQSLSQSVCSYVPPSSQTWLLKRNNKNDKALLSQDLPTNLPPPNLSLCLGYDSVRPQTCLSVQHLSLTIYLNDSLRFLTLSPLFFIFIEI